MSTITPSFPNHQKFYANRQVSMQLPIKGWTKENPRFIQLPFFLCLPLSHLTAHSSPILSIVMHNIIFRGFFLLFIRRLPSVSSTVSCTTCSFLYMHSYINPSWNLRLQFFSYFQLQWLTWITPTPLLTTILWILKVPFS